MNNVITSKDQMNLKFKLSFIVFLIGNFVFSQAWIETNIADFATIEFPVESEKLQSQGETVLLSQDELAIYKISYRKLNAQLISIIDNQQIYEFYKGVADGTIDAAQGDLISQNELIVSGLDALDLEYSASGNPELPKLRFKRIIYFNQYLIHIDFWPLNEIKEDFDKVKSKFFDSFSINSNTLENTHLLQTDNNSDGNSTFKIGFLIGQIVFYLVLLASAIGLILIIRYFVKRNKNKSINDVTTKPVQAISTPLNLICDKCDCENNSNSKYCKNCGFELPKER